AGPTITRIELETEANVAGLAAADFERLAQSAKAGCLVSRALAGVAAITMKANLVTH
ncbi:peroxiredoxin, partial [Mesorhizobium sp. M2D.F.Ca.ET.160.01.1.1]